MFSIRRADEGRIALSGRLDASEVDGVRSLLGTVTESCVLDFSDLEYISSLGLGVLLEAQKRLSRTGQGLVIVSPTAHIRDLFELAGFDRIFEIR
ncbi:MAG: STAS domain-containing protein [Candidatus Eisenbacteria bacterium]|nr:STAS domain-containing protein [Candidatus Eisenbacteria bacterium]